MKDLQDNFEDKLKDITSYLDFLDSIEKQVQDVHPKGGLNSKKVTPQQQKILYSSVYLQLYNLVESTINKFLEGISELIIRLNLKPSDLSVEWRKIWIKCIARTDINLSYDKRLESYIELYDHLVGELPISTSIFVRGPGANWDDEEIYALSRRLGLPLKISKESLQAVKRPIKDGMGTLKLIKEYRNKLSHGNLSFVECGENITVSDLKNITSTVEIYLKEVITCFVIAIREEKYLSDELINRKEDLA